VIGQERSVSILEIAIWDQGYRCLGGTRGI